MNKGSVERRRGRRVNVQAAVSIRRIGEAKPTEATEHAIRNISLAGTYFEAEGGSPYQINEVLMTSISIPEAHRREFPFTRLAGKSRVVRVQELPGAQDRLGVALEFGADMTALAAIPTRG